MIQPDTKSEDRIDVSAAKEPAGREAPAEVSARPSDHPKGAGHNVSVKELHAHYGENHAVNGLSIEFPANEVTAIIGPSGCGKSTLIRCINRMHEEIPGARAQGSVTLDGLDVYGDGVEVTAVRRLIGKIGRAHV